MKTVMFYVFVLGMSALLCARIAWGEEPIPAEEWTQESRIWLARSCVGEAGWDRHEECAAIAWVYARRAKSSPRYNFIGMIKAYSAAVKRRRAHPHPWILELVPDATRPASWPSGPLWTGRYDKRWKRTLHVVDRWAAGNWSNPCPGANHYAGWVDRERTPTTWRRIKCLSPMRNRFYSSL